MRAIPFDFTSEGIALGTAKACKKWRTDHRTLKQWISAQSPEWQAQRQINMKTLTRAASSATIKRFNELAKNSGGRRRGINLGGPGNVRLMPAELPEYALTHSHADCATQFLAGTKTVQRWLSSMPPEWHAERDRRIMEKRAATLTGRPAKTPKPPKEPRGRKTPHDAVRAAGRTGPVVFRMKPRTAMVRGEPLGEPSMAATFLRRRIPQVYNERKAVTGDKWGDIWIVGTRRMTTEAMIDLARAEGWDSDGWRTVMPTACQGASA